MKYLEQMIRETFLKLGWEVEVEQEQNVIRLRRGNDEVLLVKRDHTCYWLWKNKDREVENRGNVRKPRYGIFPGHEFFLELETFNSMSRHVLRPYKSPKSIQ